MQITTYEYEMSFGTFSPVAKIIKLDCSGLGTEMEPFIITRDINLPKYFAIKESNHHIIFQNSKIKIVSIIKSQNISFDHSQIESIEFVKCRRCSLKETTINHSLTVKKSSNISINDCMINSLKIKKSRDISLNNNQIKFSKKNQ